MRQLLLLAILVSAAPASAASFVFKLPASLPLTRALPLAPAPFTISLPSKLPPLPLTLPAELREQGPAATAPFLRWDLLNDDNDGLDALLVPVGPEPKPLPPSGAMVQLKRAVETPGEIFESPLMPSLTR